MMLNARLLCFFISGFLFVVASVEAAQKVLVILSNNETIQTYDDPKDPTKGAHTYKTGYYLNELMVPVLALMDAGYQVEFATSGGRSAIVDLNSVSPIYFKSHPEMFEIAKTWIFSELNRAHAPRGSFRNPHTFNFRNEDLNEFAAVFIPGGHAPMDDFPWNKPLGYLLQNVHRAGKLIVAICHGPAGLLSTKVVSGGKPWNFAGYQIRAFSNMEESFGEKPERLGGFLSWHLEDRIREFGGIIEPGKSFSSSVVRDRNLITGQNPQSDDELAQYFVEALSVKLFETAATAGALVNWNGGPIDSSSSNPFVATLLADFSGEVTTLFVGTRKTEVESSVFHQRLGAHISTVAKAFAPIGLKGYVIWTDGDREIAFMNWQSQKAMEAAFSSLAGKQVAEDAGSFMNMSRFSPIASEICAEDLRRLLKNK